MANTLSSRKHPALTAGKARCITAMARLPSLACLLSNTLLLCAQNYIRTQTSSVRSLCPHSWSICCIASSRSAWAKDELFSREIQNTKDKQGDEQVANTSPSKQSLYATEWRLVHNYFENIASEHTTVPVPEVVNFPHSINWKIVYDTARSDVRVSFRVDVWITFPWLTRTKL